jgi:BirA family biotin operon repressor/biotin-[acetyl-CoA-carboxylase] ligase
LPLRFSILLCSFDYRDYSTFIATMTKIMHPEEITAQLATTLLPSEVVCFETLSSTMDEVRKRAIAGAPEGLLVIAEQQSAGRGRLGRVWQSPPMHNLYMSWLLRPKWLPSHQVYTLTMLFGVSLCAAISDLTSVSAGLKWPNDLLLPLAPGDGNLGKAAGILVDGMWRGHGLEFANIGCGVNVNAHPPLDPSLQYPPTSLAAACGHPVDRLLLLRSFIQYLDKGYEALRQERYDELFQAWRSSLVTLGKQVRVHTPIGELQGIAEDVLPSGALILRSADGERHTITTGDVAA